MCRQLDPLTGSINIHFASAAVTGGARAACRPRLAAMNAEQLLQAVAAGKRDGKKAVASLDQKIAKSLRDGKQSEEDIAGMVNTLQPKGGTVVHRACENADPDMLALLLKHGGDPNAVSVGGATPLLAALLVLGRGGREDPPATKPVAKKYERLCAMLLKHAAFDRDASDITGPMMHSPIYLCVREDLKAHLLLPLLKLFLARGFNPSGQPRGDNVANGGAAYLPALHMAVSHGHFKCAAALAEAGADAEAKALVASAGGLVTAMELCESLGEKELVAELKRLELLAKAKAKVLAAGSGGGADAGGAGASSGDGDGSRASEPELVMSLDELDEETVARIREEAKAEKKRQKAREKKKKAKEKARAAASEQAAQNGTLTVVHDDAAAADEDQGEDQAPADFFLDSIEIELVMEQAHVSGLTRERAIQALANHDGDPVEAILELEGAIDYKGNNLLVVGEAGASLEPEPAAMAAVEEDAVEAEAEAREAREDRAAELPPMTPR